MSYPNDELPNFNDSSNKIAPSPKAIQNFFQNLINFDDSLPFFGSKFLSSSGYLRMQNKSALVIFDIAQIGAKYLPGHGHADTLSLETLLFNKRLFVNLEHQNMEMTKGDILKGLHLHILLLKLMEKTHPKYGMDSE